MGVELRRSSIPAERVGKLVDQRLQAFRDLKGRNPNDGEKEKMKSEIVNLAKKIEKDRRG